MKVERVHTEHGSHIEPPLDPTWSKLDKLIWKAACIEHDSGLRLEIEERPNGFTIMSPGTGFGSACYSYVTAWNRMNGLEAGAEMYQRQRRFRDGKRGSES